MGIDEEMIRRTLRSRINADVHKGLAKDIVALRPEVLRRLKEAGLDGAVHHFDPERFNPAVPLGGNLFYATPSREITPQSLATDMRMIRMLDETRDGMTVASMIAAIRNLPHQPLPSEAHSDELLGGLDYVTDRIRVLLTGQAERAAG
jgi:putative ABC transport system ATP-binding protein